MPTNKKPNWSLIIAVSLPILMIAAVTLSIYVPSRFQTFRGQFLYSIQEGTTWGGNGLTVVNGKLQEVPVAGASKTVHPSTGTVRIYIHDISTDQSRAITRDEAKQLTLDPSPRSIDGMQIEYGTHADGIFPFFIFASDDYSSIYVKGDRGSRKLNVRVRQGSFYNQFQFIGWIKS